MTAVDTGAQDSRIVRKHEDANYLLISFQVGAFRGLKDVALRQLTRFNLIVGGNNSGKTSLLEAIAVYFAPIDMVSWADIARTRDVRAVAPWRSAESPIDSIRWLFPRAVQAEDELHLPIHLTAGGGRFTGRDLHASCEPMRGIPPTSAFDNRFSGPPDVRQEPGIEAREDTGWLIRVREVPPRPGAFQLTSSGHTFPLWSRLGIRYGELPRRSGPPVFLLPPYAHRNEATNLYLMRRAAIGDWTREVIDLLGRIDPAISGVEVVPTENGVAALMIRHKDDGLIPVNVLGDGVRRALSIALTIRAARGGIVLIDEIEAALHISALGRFIPWFTQACIDNDVQVIATTHSLEAITTITSQAILENFDDLAAYHLPDRSQNLSPKRYSGEMLNRVVVEHGLDIR